MPQPAGSPLPTTRTFTGWGLDPKLLARAAGQWLKDKGYEVRATSSGDTHLVQARFADSGWKGWFSKCPSLDARVTGGPSGFTVGFGDGTWGIDPAQITIGHKVGGFLTAVWAGDAEHRRRGIESEFWAAVEAACRACGLLDRAVSLAGTVTGTSRSAGEVRRDGTLPGVEEYHENYRCSACDHRWAGPKKYRSVDLCPGCERPCKPEMTGETVVRASLVGEVTPGDFVGDVAYRNNYRCPTCSHTWQGPEGTRRGTVCPACVRPVKGIAVRREVSDTVTRMEMRPVREDHYSNDGSGTPKRVGHTWRHESVQIRYEVTVGVFRCEHCSHEWVGGQQERRLG